MARSLEKPNKFIEMNTRFHFAIYSCADLPIVLRLIDLMWARVGPYLSIYLTKGPHVSYAMICHQGMYEALADRHKKRAKEHLRKDLEEAAKFLIPSLTQVRLPLDEASARSGNNCLPSHNPT
jgi:DNA-binding GntR family transcriptional regulator